MRVLAFSFYFPPHGGPGSIRPLKMLKYGSRLGLEGTVIAASESDYSICDDSLLGEVPSSFEIVRTPTGLDPLGFLRRARPGLIHAPKSDYIFLPDNKTWWVNPAVYLGTQLEPRADIIWATCPPYSAGTAAMIAARELGVPLVLDFRDSWTRNPNRPRLTFIHRLINRAKARRVVSSASLVTCVYEAICTEMSELAPGTDVVHLSNGYDPEDQPAKRPKEIRGDKLRLFYLGTIYPNLNYPLPVLEAMLGLPEVSLCIAGRYPTRLLMDIERLGIGEQVELLGYLPHRESLERASAADLMLLYIDSRPLNRGQITSKTYEYLGLGKAILACVPDNGEAAALLEGYCGAFLADPCNTDRIYGILEEILDRKMSGNLPVTEPREEHSRSFIARQWVDLLYDVIKKYPKSSV